MKEVDDAFEGGRRVHDSRESKQPGYTTSEHKGSSYWLEASVSQDLVVVSSDHVQRDKDFVACFGRGNFSTVNDLGVAIAGPKILHLTEYPRVIEVAEHSIG